MPHPFEIFESPAQICVRPSPRAHQGSLDQALLIRHVAWVHLVQSMKILFFCYIALPLALPVSLEMRTFRKRREEHCGLTWKWDGGTLDDLLTSSNSPSHTFPHRFHLTGPVLLQNILHPDALQCNHPSRRKCLLPLVPSCNKVSETPLHCALIDTLIRGNYWSTI